MLVCFVQFVFTVSNNFIFTWKKIIFLIAQNLLSIKTFLVVLTLEQWNLVSVARVAALFVKLAKCCQQQLLLSWKRPVFVLARLTCQSCPRALPQDLEGSLLRCGPQSRDVVQPPVFVTASLKRK